MTAGKKQALEAMLERVYEMRRNQEELERQVTDLGVKGLTFKRWKAASESAEQKIKKQIERLG